MGRKTARKNAFLLCYQMSFYDVSEINKILSYFYSENSIKAEDKDYITTIVTGTFDNLEEIDGLIQKCSEKWDTGRIGRVDMAILRACVYELLHMGDIPVNVSINEAVELAKRFGADESPAFINGILGGVNKYVGK